VEALVQVTDPAARSLLSDAVALSMDEQTSAFELRADGSWHRRLAVGHPLVQPQEALLRRIVARTTVDGV
jgi:polyphosphate kinase